MGNTKKLDENHAASQYKISLIMTVKILDIGLKILNYNVDYPLRDKSICLKLNGFSSQLPLFHHLNFSDINNVKYIFNTHKKTGYIKLCYVYIIYTKL